MRMYLSTQQVPYTGVGIETFIETTTNTVQDVNSRTFVSFRVAVNLTSTAMPSPVVMQLSSAVSALLELNELIPVTIIPGSLGLRTFTLSGTLTNLPV